MAEALRSLGVESADDLTVAVHLGDPAAAAALASMESIDPLRFAPDWRSPELTPRGAALRAAAAASY